MVRLATFGSRCLLVSLLASGILRGEAQTQTQPQAPPQPTVQFAPGPIDATEIDALLKKFSVPGVSIAVIKDFKIDWARGYGLADVETATPVTAETMFQAASISKPVAAMVSMRAVQDGRFALDQDVNTILKSWKLPGGEHTKDRPVTPRGLMSHTSGTGDGFGFPGYVDDADRPREVPDRSADDSRQPRPEPVDGSSALAGDDARDGDACWRWAVRRGLLGGEARRGLVFRP